MGSVFTTTSGNTVKGFGGRLRPIPYFLQFVPGYCVEVVHSEESLRYNGPNSINSIIALPHHTDKVYKTRASAGDDYRYYPLLRTINDVPSKGDPVLLCTIGKINYYLGPLNTDKNSPTWNDDPSFRRELILSDKKVGKVSSQRGIKGESLNFNKETLYSRLSKKKKDELESGPVIRETTGDTIIEGRHGNSLRIGSRSNNPYVFISNERNPKNSYESFGDGTLISITSNGTLQQHFGGFEDVVNEESVAGFKLSSDGSADNTYPIGDIYRDLNNLSDDTTLYNYSGNQMLLHSDRIILNSKGDDGDIYLSSKRDIHIGAGINISIGASKSLNILSNNVNIGNNTKATLQSMVLGDTLKEVLTKIVELFSKIKIASSGQPAGILSDPTYAAVGGVKEDIDTIVGLINEKLTSTKHKIEQG